MTTPTPEQIEDAFALLRGEKQFNGLWFGDAKPAGKYKRAYWWRTDVLPILEQALTAKDARIKELEGALRFYADPASYALIYGESTAYSPVDVDEGYKAQAALAAKE